MVSNVLFNPGVNNTLAKLDDSKSMFSIAIRDGVDSSGRTLMEYKRNPHGGRERLIEEFLTVLIWGFGINFMKNKVYDPIAKRFSKVQHPDLDMDLLMKGPQKLTPELLETFSKRFPGAYDKLNDVLHNPALQKAYHKSNVAKFMVATAIPVLLIALGIPTFNQWLTRKRLEAEQAKSPMGSTQPHQPIRTSFRQPNAFSAFAGGVTLPAAPLAGSVKFGGLGTSAAMGVSALLQNERYNTLLVDGVLSGGRIYKARNWVERMEILFREATIVFFLYFAQGAIQKKIGHWIDKLMKADSRLDFRSVRHLQNQYGQDSAKFLADYERSIQALETKIPNLRQLLKSPNKLAGLEKPLADAVREYALKEGKNNIFFETAKASEWIKMMDGPGGQKLLDLTKKVQTQPILDMIPVLEKMAGKAAVEKNFVVDQVLKKSMSGRFSALILANLVCAFFLSYLCPKIQHWITYKRTGQNHFPGISA